jgi:hypothetical protein
MKDIEDMNLLELADDLTTLPSCSVRPYVLDTIDRLRVLHDLTRWIPVSEQMPSIEDAYRHNVLWIDKHGTIVQFKYTANPLVWNFVSWQRITPPEGA